MRPIALSDKQLEILQCGAASLPVTARAEYLEQVVVQLSSEPIDADVMPSSSF